jgi:hypothetical protein
MRDPLVDLTRKSIGETGAQVLAKDRWRYVPKSAGFQRDNTPIYNYVWEPYTEETGGDVCR